MHAKRVSLALVVFVIPFLGMVLGGAPLMADEPQGIAWKAIDPKLTGPASPGITPGGDDQVLLQLFAAHESLLKTDLLAVFPGCGQDPEVAGRPVMNLEELIRGKATSPVYNPEWKSPGPRWRMCPGANAVLLRAGQTASLNVTVDFLRLVSENMSPQLFGKVYQVSSAMLRTTRNPNQLAAMVQAQQPASTLIIDLYYAVNAEKRIWQSGDYGKIFGLPRRPNTELGKPTADYEKEQANLPVVASAFQRTLRLPGQFVDDGGRMFKATLDAVQAAGSGNAGEEICIQDDEFAARRVAAPVSGDAAEAVSWSLSGRFSTKWTSDHSLHPGFGFRVEAWTNENTGVWRMLASDWVQSNGTWSLFIPLALNYEGKLLRVLYRSYNSYYAPQNQAGNTYSWVDPDQANIGNPFFAGHRYADTDGGTYNGVGELVDAAMFMWSRLYWIGGINPVPASPIKMFFPNTWYNCGGTSPWSCANTGGNIWLIAAHGTRAEVVNHEMGHQLNYKFWDYKRPANPGGSHSLDSCYPTRLGMVLLEGFANFMAGWVGYPGRNVAAGGFGSGRWALGFDPESSVAPPNCADGYTNEAWVARTFWDLHDTHSDGDDILWFNHPGAVAALYLGHGVANDGDARDMRDYENIYRNAATPGHEGFISDIFNMNRQ
jgi:hypothetical protein